MQTAKNLIRSSIKCPVSAVPLPPLVMHITSNTNITKSRKDYRTTEITKHFMLIAIKQSHETIARNISIDTRASTTIQDKIDYLEMHIWMEDLSQKANLRWLQRIMLRHSKYKLENSTFIRSF